MHTVQATPSEETVLAMHKCTFVQRGIQEKRKLTGEPVVNSRSVAEISIPESVKQRTRGERFLLHDSLADGPDRFFIFGMEGNLDCLEGCPHCFAGGTFKIAPHHFYQVMTIHVLHGSSVLSIIYFFFQQKTRAMYKKALEVLHAIRPNV